MVVARFAPLHHVRSALSRHERRLPGSYADAGNPVELLNSTAPSLVNLRWNTVFSLSKC